MTHQDINDRDEAILYLQETHLVDRIDELQSRIKSAYPIAFPKNLGDEYGPMTVFKPSSDDSVARLQALRSVHLAGIALQAIELLLKRIQTCDRSEIKGLVAAGVIMGQSIDDQCQLASASQYQLNNRRRQAVKQETKRTAKRKRLLKELF